MLFVVLLWLLLFILAFTNGGKSSLCAQNYIDRLVHIFGNQFEGFLRSAMHLGLPRRKYKAKLNNTGPTLILNIGPGSSGTRSLYLAATQLNITSFHLGSSSINCTSFCHHPLVSFGPEFNINTLKILNSHNEFAFWGDIPVPNYWWNILNRQISSQILYIMTDMDDNKWLKNRREMCKMKAASWEWTVPLAFHPNDVEFSEPMMNESHKQYIRNAFVEAANVWKVDEATNSASFDAFRQFARCAIPAKKLLWLRIGNYSSEIFWSTLVNFIGINITKKSYESLVSGGVPYLGSKGCFIGQYNCKYRAGVSYPKPNICEGS